MTMFIVFAKVLTSYPSYGTIEGVTELLQVLECSLLLSFLFELPFYVDSRVFLYIALTIDLLVNAHVHT